MSYFYFFKYKTEYIHMKENIVKEKSFAFALRIIKMSRHLQNEKKEFVISNQVLKSGTSIGANIREAINAESSADFIHKLSISQKEADETLYWLELLRDSKILDHQHVQSVYDDGVELLKILRSIIISKKKNLKT